MKNKLKKEIKSLKQYIGPDNILARRKVDECVIRMLDEFERKKAGNFVI